MSIAPPGIHSGHGGHYKTCTHPDCVQHRLRYQKRWRLDRSRGHKRLTDSTPVRLHLDTLRGAGWSLRSIAATAGISTTTASYLVNGQPTVKHSVATAILGVDPNQVPIRASKQTTEPFVSRVGTTRRIQALLFMGWTHVEMTARSGVRTAALLHQQGRWVTRSTHDKVATLYRDLSHRPGPSERTRTRARNRGYLGPASWDDIDLDEAPELDEGDVA
jgi:lambda repressor-like predicted transcriptional regulator